MGNEINSFSKKDCVFIVSKELFDLEIIEFMDFFHFLFKKYLSNVYDNDNCSIKEHRLTMTDDYTTTITVPEDDDEDDVLDSLIENVSLFTVDLKLKNDVLYHYINDDMIWEEMIDYVVTILMDNSHKVFKDTETPYNDLTFHILADIYEQLN